MAVAARKLRLSWGEISEILTQVRAVCVVQPMTIETHERALRVAQRYGFQIYDALIVAAALLAGCRTPCIRKTCSTARSSSDN